LLEGSSLYSGLEKEGRGRGPWSAGRLSALAKTGTSSGERKERPQTYRQGRKNLRLTRDGGGPRPSKRSRGLESAAYKVWGSRLSWASRAKSITTLLNRQGADPKAMGEMLWIGLVGARSTDIRKSQSRGRLLTKLSGQGPSK